MESNTAITLILILLSLLGIQIVVLVILKRMISNMARLTNELNQAKHRFAIKNSKEVISDKSFKTCQNCIYRQSFLKKNISDSAGLLFYRCKLNGTEVNLKDTCTKFQLESFTQNS